MLTLQRLDISKTLLNLSKYMKNVVFRKLNTLFKIFFLFWCRQKKKRNFNH